MWRFNVIYIFRAIAPAREKEGLLAERASVKKAVTFTNLPVGVFANLSVRAREDEADIALVIYAIAVLSR